MCVSLRQQQRSLTYSSSLRRSADRHKGCRDKCREKVPAWPLAARSGRPPTPPRSYSSAPRRRPFIFMARPDQSTLRGNPYLTRRHAGVEWRLAGGQSAAIQLPYYAAVIFITFITSRGRSFTLGGQTRRCCRQALPATLSAPICQVYSDALDRSCCVHGLFSGSLFTCLAASPAKR